MIAAACDERPPLTVEARLALFTQLVGTAISNAETKVQLIVSRARIVRTADATRRRIERDLHDGVQQHLISLALRLRTAQVAAPRAARELAERLDGVIEGLGAVIDELREISRGIHPSALVQGGLRPALKTLARRSAVPVRLDVRIEDRLPEQIEVAAYYAIAESLTNAAKHAQAWPRCHGRRRGRHAACPGVRRRVRWCEPREGLRIGRPAGTRRSTRRAGVAGEPSWGRDDGTGRDTPPRTVRDRARAHGKHAGGRRWR